MKRRFPLFFAAETDTATAAPAAPTGEPPEPAAEPGDWAEEVTKQIQPQPVQHQPKTESTPAPTPEQKKTETKADPIPSELFGKKEEKKPEPKVESEIDKIETPEFRGESTRKGWDALKGKAKELEGKYQTAEQRVAELTKQLDAASEGSKKAQELEERLRKAEQQADEYRGLVQKVNIDLDPEFRRTYVQGRDNLIGAAKRIAEDSGVEASTIEAALNLRGKARSDALREAAGAFSPFDVSRLGSIIQQLDQLDADAQAKRGNPDEFFKQREAEARAQHEQQQKRLIEETNKAYQRAESDMAEKLLVLRKLEGEQFKDWNDRADKLRQSAKEFWEGNQDPRRAAEITIKGHVAEVYEEAYKEMKGDRDSWKEKAEKFEAELGKLYGGGPKLLAPTGGSKDGKPAEWADQVVAKMSGGE